MEIDIGQGEHIMTDKLIIGALTVMIFGVMGYGIYITTNLVNDSDVDTQIIAIEPEPQPTATAQPTLEQIEATIEQNVVSVPTAQPTIAQQDVAVAANVTTPEPAAMASDMVGEPWSATGIIVGIEDFGFTLAVGSDHVFVELGPPDYWQAQSVTLVVGAVATVEGWINDEQIHARVVTTASGDLLLRSESSQPLWAGGTSNGQSQSASHGGTADGQAGQSRFQVAPEDWLTISGTVSSVSNGAVVMLAVDGTSYNLQMGQPRFWQSQGVTLEVGDAIEVLGFWMNQEFTVGDITKIATGEHIILRDPNGRQLWAGPGRSGESGGNSNGGNNNGSNGSNGYHGGQ
jgi:hypothetical protein